MSPKKPHEPTPVEPKEFRSPEEIDAGIRKLERRITELERLDVRKAIIEQSGDVDVVRSNVRETIREVFGSNSPEFREHEHLRIWAGPM